MNQERNYHGLGGSYLSEQARALQFAPNSQPRVSEPVIASATLGSKVDRCWTLDTIKTLHSRAQEYSAQHSKIIDSLTVEDMASIAAELNKSPQQCLHKLREVVITGSFRPGEWSKAEDELLLSLIQEHLPWKECANQLNSVLYGNLKVRSGKQCKERWSNHLNPAIKRGRWTLHEECELMEVFLELGRHWSLISNRLGNRTDNSVKNRIKSLLNAEFKNFGVTDETVAAQRIIRRNQREINAEYQ